MKPERKLISSLALALLLTLGAAALPGIAGAADSAKAERIWQSGPVEVFALFDRGGQAPISLFSGPASPAERAAYFENGQADSGVTCYLIRSGKLNLLVDTGFGETAPGRSFLEESLAEAGIGVDDVNFVLLTHMHLDHLGGMLKNNERVFKAATVLVAQPELDYWLAEASANPENSWAALAARVAEVYQDDIRLLYPQDSDNLSFHSVAGVGVTPVQAYGHTPGHTAFLVEEGDDSLLIVGDLVHAASLQFPRPDEAAEYDLNADAARATRKKIMNFAAREKIRIAGMHIPYSGDGMVEKDGAGFKLVR